MPVKGLCFEPCGRSCAMGCSKVGSRWLGVVCSCGRSPTWWSSLSESQRLCVEGVRRRSMFGYKYYFSRINIVLVELYIRVCLGTGER